MRLEDGAVIDVAEGSTAEGHSSVEGVAVCRDGLRRFRARIGRGAVWRSGPVGDAPWVPTGNSPRAAGRGGGP